MVNQNNGQAQKNIKLLSLQEIAAWWIDVPTNSEQQSNSEQSNQQIQVALPPLQRGFVWRPDQVAGLWDSLVRGFPIGSLLLAKRDKQVEPAEAHIQDKEVNTADYWLLDGQQRVTSIVMGFRDFLKERDGEKEPEEALWVDLEPLEGKESHFAFIMTTRSHPWGYSRDNPGKTLAAGDMNKALECFIDSNNKRPVDLKMREVFPWDAHAPFPLFLLLRVLSEEEPENSHTTKQWTKKICKRLLGYFDNHQDYHQLQCMKEKCTDGKHLACTYEILQQSDNTEVLNKLTPLFTGLKRTMSTFRVPAPVLETVQLDHEQEKNEGNESISVLFKRINASGTPLSDEEIAYSQLKAVWPAARNVIEDELLKEIGQLAQPARMAMLLFRLCQWIHDRNDGDQGKPLGIPSAADVQKALKDKKFKDDLENLFLLKISITIMIMLETFLKMHGNYWHYLRLKITKTKLLRTIFVFLQFLQLILPPPILT